MSSRVPRRCRTGMILVVCVMAIDTREDRDATRPMGGIIVVVLILLLPPATSATSEWRRDIITRASNDLRTRGWLQLTLSSPLTRGSASSHGTVRSEGGCSPVGDDVNDVDTSMT